MARNTKRIEVRSSDGKLMFSLRVYDEAAGVGNEAKTSSNRNGQSYRESRNGNGGKDADGMTDAQKRYLFRILADRGLEGDDAHNHLKERFGVSSLTEVSKREASTVIEQLLEEAEAK